MRPVSSQELKPEERATEAFQVGSRIFEDSDCLPATFWDTLDAPNQLQNESRNRLRNGAEMSPKPVLQEGAKVSPKVTWGQLWAQGARERPSINFNEV